MVKPTLTDPEAKIIRSALGLQRSPTPYRKHYCAPAAGLARDLCETLARRGMLLIFHTEPNGTRFFHVTAAGAAAVGHSLPVD